MVLYTPGRTSPYPEDPVESGLRVFFLGGGDEVGNVGCILEDRTGTRSVSYTHLTLPTILLV